MLGFRSFWSCGGGNRGLDTGVGWGVGVGLRYSLEIERIRLVNGWIIGEGWERYSGREEGLGKRSWRVVFVLGYEGLFVFDF